MQRQPKLGVTQLEQRETPGSILPPKSGDVGKVNLGNAGPSLFMGPTAGNTIIVEIDFTIIPPSSGGGG